MDNKKFEQLIDMIINENEEQARELFHEIVVEKSREIYESMMDQEDDMMETSGDMVGDLQSEIESDNQMSMNEEEEEELDDISMDMDDMEMDDEEDEMQDEAELEDRVVDLEDKLDELMAEFEEIMGRDEEMGDEEEMMGDEEEEEGEEEAMMEAIQLKKVSVTHGDNGAQTKSVVSNGPKVPGNGAAPVNFSGGADSKGRANPSVKDVDGSSSWQNKAGKDMSKPGKAPAPVKSQASGTNTKDVVPGN
jgi:hypothetical protein